MPGPTADKGPLLRFHLNIHPRPLGDGVEHRGVRGQSFQSFHVVYIGPDLEVDADVCKAFRDVTGETQKTTQIDITLQFGLQFLDMDPTHRRVRHHTGGDTGGRGMKQRLQQVGVVLLLAFPESAFEAVVPVLVGVAVLLVLVVVFGFVLPQLADYRVIADYIQGIEPFEWLLLAVFAGWFLVAYVFVFMATLPSLHFKEGFVVQTTATAINNSLPAGGAIALPITYSQFLSWGFTPGAVTAGLLTAGVWDQLARQALPVLAVAVIALLGEAVWWMWLVSIVGVISVGIWIGVLTVILRWESAAVGFGRWLTKVVNWFTRKLHRDPVDMVAALRADEFDVVYACTAPSPRGVPGAQVARAARDLGCDEVYVHDTVEAACEAALAIFRRGQEPEGASLVRAEMSHGLALQGHRFGGDPRFARQWNRSDLFVRRRFQSLFGVVHRFPFSGR